MSKLQENEKCGSYVVQTFIKKGMYDETYFVTDPQGTRHFLKLFLSDEVPSVAQDSHGQILEIVYAERLNHPNVIKLEEKGLVFIDGVANPFMVTSFIAGELLESHLFSGHRFDVDTTLAFSMCMLGALSHLHGQQLMHCDITPRNIIYSEADGTPNATLIDLGHLSRHPLDQITFLTADLEPWYRAPETFRGQFGPESDIFSLAAVIYTMLYGQAPWKDDTLSDTDNEATIRSKVHMARKKPLTFDGRDDVPQWLKAALTEALQLKPDYRLKSADLFMQLLVKKGKHSDEEGNKKESPGVKNTTGDHPDKKEDKERRDRGQVSTSAEFIKPQGNGFADVAGMDDLKLRLQQRVLFVLKNKEKAQVYKLTPPNGMLLYGPPGCGKTYFAQKFAEESGFNCCFVKGSDLGSTFIHGSQTMIADLFDKALQNAPAVVCIDEIDALLPVRGTRGLEYTSGEVNEFLSQMNECGKRGIFVVGTTNRPSLIDPAALRKGRLDIVEYVPAPDLPTRKLMFDLYLKDRPCSEIDTYELATSTERYVASDIAYIVNDAALIAALRDEPISQETLKKCIKNTQPSLNEKLMEEYKKINKDFENGRSHRTSVGFQAILDQDLQP